MIASNTGNTGYKSCVYFRNAVRLFIRQVLADSMHER